VSLLYRAIWRDDRPDLINLGRPIFRSWLDSKNIGIVLPDNGVERDDLHDVAATEVRSMGSIALRLRLNEERPVSGGAERWTTTVHLLCEEGEQGWVWVDLEWVSDDAFARPPIVAAPNLVGRFLDADGSRRGSVRLGPKPTLVGADDVNGLVDWLFTDERTAPVVVFSVDRALGPQGYSERVRTTAKRLAGCVDVRMLTADSEMAFSQVLGPMSLDVFNGAARVYLPGIDRDDPQAWRHRWIAGFRLGDSPAHAASRIAAEVMPRLVAVRPPALYRNHIKPLLDESLGEQRDWQSYAEELDGQVSSLSREIDELRDERELALLEALDAEERIADLVRRVEALRMSIRVQGESPEVIEQEAEAVAVPRSCAEAVERGRALPNLVIPDGAAVDIDRLDQSAHADLWGQRIWSHLQSLDAYAGEKGNGFETWCRTSGSPFAISPKFISMTEGETVRYGMAESRTFVIDPLIDPSGRILMLAHTKPVQGGGLQIPRIYFHDDSKGATGKVHVGFIGPHDLVPNKATN
jgi:hypothetical protein